MRSLFTKIFGFPYVGKYQSSECYEYGKNISVKQFIDRIKDETLFVKFDSERMMSTLDEYLSLDCASKRLIFVLNNPDFISLFLEEEFDINEYTIRLVVSDNTRGDPNATDKICTYIEPDFSYIGSAKCHIENFRKVFPSIEDPLSIERRISLYQFFIEIKKDIYINRKFIWRSLKI